MSSVCGQLFGPYSIDGPRPSFQVGQLGVDYAAFNLHKWIGAPVGLGAMYIRRGALAGIVWAIPLIVSAVRSMQSAARVKSAVSQDEMPIRLLYAAVVGAAVVLMIIATLSTEHVGIGRGIAMAVLGTRRAMSAGEIVAAVRAAAPPAVHRHPPRITGLEEMPVALEDRVVELLDHLEIVEQPEAAPLRRDD